MTTLLDAPIPNISGRLVCQHKSDSRVCDMAATVNVEQPNIKHTPSFCCGNLLFSFCFPPIPSFLLSLNGAASPLFHCDPSQRDNNDDFGFPFTKCQSKPQPKMRAPPNQ